MTYLTVIELREKILNEVANIPSRELVLKFLEYFRDTDKFIVFQPKQEGSKEVS